MLGPDCSIHGIWLGVPPAKVPVTSPQALAPFPLMQTLINALKAGLAGHPSQLAAIILRGCAVVGTSGSGSFVSIPPDQKVLADNSHMYNNGLLCHALTALGLPS